jgi:hypothetical protein
MAFIVRWIEGKGRYIALAGLISRGKGRDGSQKSNRYFQEGTRTIHLKTFISQLI